MLNFNVAAGNFEAIVVSTVPDSLSSVGQISNHVLGEASGCARSETSDQLDGCSVFAGTAGIACTHSEGVLAARNQAVLFPSLLNETIDRDNLSIGELVDVGHFGIIDNTNGTIVDAVLPADTKLRCGSLRVVLLEKLRHRRSSASNLIEGNDRASASNVLSCDSNSVGCTVSETDSSVLPIGELIVERATSDSLSAD